MLGSQKIQLTSFIAVVWNEGQNISEVYLCIYFKIIDNTVFFTPFCNCSCSLIWCLEPLFTQDLIWYRLPIPHPFWEIPGCTWVTGVTPSVLPGPTRLWRQVITLSTQEVAGRFQERTTGKVWGLRPVSLGFSVTSEVASCFCQGSLYPAFTFPWGSSDRVQIPQSPS